MCTLRHTRTRLERVNDGAVALLFPFELRSAVVEAAAKAMHAYLGAPADGTEPLRRAGKRTARPRARMH